MAIFEGIFKPPGIGAQDVPIKIAGRGRCELTSAGLRVQGFKHTPKVKPFQWLIFLFALICCLAYGLVSIHISLNPKLLFIPFTLVIFPFFAGQFLKGQGTDHQKEAIELLIPWENISRTRLDKTAEVVTIKVQKFWHQGERYQGALYFDPFDEVDTLLSALQGYGVVIST